MSMLMLIRKLIPKETELINTVEQNKQRTRNVKYGIFGKFLFTANLNVTVVSRSRNVNCSLNCGLSGGQVYVANDRLHVKNCTQK